MQEGNKNQDETYGGKRTFKIKQEATELNTTNVNLECGSCSITFCRFQFQFIKVEFVLKGQFKDKQEKPNYVLLSNTLSESHISCGNQSALLTPKGCTRFADVETKSRNPE